MCVLQLTLISVALLVLIIPACLTFSPPQRRLINRLKHEEYTARSEKTKRPVREAQFDYPDVENRYGPWSRPQGFRQNQFQNGFNWAAPSNGRTRGRNPFNQDAIIFEDDDNFPRSNRIPPGLTPATTPTNPTTTVRIPGMETTRSPCEDTCQITPQYNPVCGSDTLTYSNMARLTCAQNCGKRVKLLYYGSCTRIPNQ